MFKLPTWVGKYNLFINAFKARGILNSSEKIKVHSNLVKRCVKNVPIRIYKRKTILELENIESRVLNFCESTRIKVTRIFSVSPAHFEGYEGTPICVWNKARGILNSSEKFKVHSNLIKLYVSAEGNKYFSIFYFRVSQLTMDNIDKQLEASISQALLQVEKDLSLPGNSLVDETPLPEIRGEVRLKSMVVRLDRNFMSRVPDRCIKHSSRLKLRKRVAEQDETISLLMNGIEVLLNQ